MTIVSFAISSLVEIWTVKADTDSVVRQRVLGRFVSGSRDSAAACISTISELHNPLVNASFTKRIKVVGE